jgi:hypothetical protein
MTPEAAQDLQAYFGLFGDDEEDEPNKESKNEMKLTESRLRRLVREEMQKLNELGIDRGFLASFKEAIESMTGVRAEIKEGPENEDSIFLSTEGSPVDIVFRSGGSTGLRGGNEEVAVQIIGTYTGSVRSGFTAPLNPQAAAERTFEELKKINVV